MNPNWTDFEKYVFTKLSEIERDIAALKGRAAMWGAVAGVAAGAVSHAFITIIGGH